MKRILFLGAPHIVGLSDKSSTHQLLNATGNNTGNLFIGYSVHKQLEYDKKKSTTLPVKAEVSAMDLEAIGSDYDCIVVSASNFVNSYADWSLYADLLERTNLPCVVIGLGSQIDIDYSTNIKLKDGTFRFLKILSERSHSIGVRGQFTAEYLQKIGIRNVEVIGCPSFFYNMNPSLKVTKKVFSKITKIAFNSDPTIYNSKENYPKLKDFYETMFEYNSRYIVQNEISLAIMARKNRVEITDDVVKEALNFFSWNKNDLKYLNFIKQNIDIFFGIPEWESWIKSFDFSIGPRFHGNMIALQNDVPALILVHDGRTRELCEFLKLPHVFLRDLGTINIEKLYESLDLGEMESIYSNRFSNYANFLTRNGLQHKLFSGLGSKIKKVAEL